MNTDPLKNLGNPGGSLSKEYLQLIIDSSTIGILTTDDLGSIICANRAAAKLLGNKLTEIELTGSNILTIFTRIDLNIEGLIKKALNGEPFDIHMLPIEIMPGEKHYLNIHAIQLENGLMVTLYDETANVEKEQLQKESDKLKELNQLKDEFLNIAAHDLRTPATAIKVSLELILSDKIGKIPLKIKHIIEKAYDSNTRLINLINDFLTVSRLELGKMKIVSKKTNLEKLVSKSIEELIDTARKKNLKIIYKKQKLPFVYIDEERIIQVLNNLIYNAIKFTKTGSITVSHEITDNEVITKITDTGVGIAKDIQNHLFEKFYRSTKDSQIPGLGLGLYICKVIVERLGGKVGAESELGKGATFSFSLPFIK